MFGWLFPRPPLDIVEKAWTERHMLWLAEQFGLPRLLAAPVSLPEPEFLGEHYDGTLESGQHLMARIGAHLAIDPAQCRLEVVTQECGGEASPTTSLGTVPLHTVPINTAQLDDPAALAATLGHELVRGLLPVESRAMQNQTDADWLADLAAVYLGLGVHIANAVVSETTQQGGHACHCGPRRIRHLPARMVGYAMALFAHVRGEARPAWKTYLRLDALVAYSRGLTYLQRTGDTLFTAVSAGREKRQIATEELLQQLATGSGSARVAALWDLRAPRHATGAAHAVSRCLHDRLPAIREEAAKTVAMYETQGQQALPSLVELLHDAKYSIRAAAAHALGILGSDSTDVLWHLTPLLSDPDPQVIFSSAAAVRRFGQQGEEALPAVLAALRAAMIRGDHPLIDALTHTLFALDPDPTDRVMQFFDDDAELREQTVHVIVDALREHGGGKFA